MLEAADELKVKPITIQRALALMDSMLSLKDMGKETMELLTLACLMIGVKLEEVEIKAVYELLRWFKAPWNKQIQAMELFICQSLNWRLYPITPLEVIENLGLYLKDVDLVKNSSDFSTHSWLNYGLRC